MGNRPHRDNGEGVAQRPLPYPLREPQWLETKSTIEVNGEATTEGGEITSARAYLCGSAPVQNFPLELHAFQWGYAARAVPNGVSGRRGRDEGARREDSGRRHYRPGGCASNRPYVKRRGGPLSASPRRVCGYRRGSPRVPRAAAWRKWYRAMTGECSAPSPRGVSPAYKPPVKGQGRRGDAGKAS